jgi:putative tryptophan/tyrosine transport system substrate-binding protein
VRRREFIALVGGALAWPLTASAQQADRIRRIGVLQTTGASDPQGQARNAAFLQGLQQLGWSESRNLRIETRWNAADAGEMRKYAVEFAGLAPDVVLASGANTVGPLLQVARTVPIVFVNVVDPVGAGLVKSLARPGGNATGFILFEYSLGGKWLELLKQIAPAVKRVAVLRDPTITSGIGQFGAIQTAAPSAGVEVSPINLSDVGDIEQQITEFARSSKDDSGLIVAGSALAVVHRGLIISIAAQHKLPAVYSERFFVTGGGLISYGPDIVNQYRRAASYVDRILKGEKPADLPVQSPTDYDLVINLKTARSVGITIPPTLLARAAEVIE